jgi:glycerol kinase
MKNTYILAIDQGTTSTRAIVFNQDGDILSRAQKPVKQFFPQAGWVEHDADMIWRDTVSVCRDAMFHQGIAPSDVAAIGITNQRETIVLWERATGKVLHHAIVWQDRRTHEVCDALKAEGHEPTVQAKTGLILDPYFSATKLAWLLDNIPGARARADKGELACGTIDTFLLWRFTQGKVYATDMTNASRTSLFNIHTLAWDDELLTLFNIPKSLLPEVKRSHDDFGLTAADLFGAPIAIAAMAGDQHAAMCGQACFEPGMMKSTYGTGAFMLLNTGDKPIQSKNRLLTTLAYTTKDTVHYALEGSVFMAGATLGWCQNQAEFFKDARERETLAASIESTGGVYCVPAFTGLGAPYWDPKARGAIVGLTHNTGVAHIVRAALEALAYQTKDLYEAMLADGVTPLVDLRVDGGVSANNRVCHNIADMLDVNVERPKVIETTALGVFYLAGLELGWFSSRADIAKRWQPEKVFAPDMKNAIREANYAGWQKAVQRVLH